MLKLSRLTDYATTVLVVISRRSPERMSAVAVSRIAHLEVPTVSKVLKLLTKGGLVESYRGAHGGYRLKRPATDISVAQIIRAIEGPIAMTECTIEANSCVQESFCGMRSNWQKVGRAVSDALEGVSLAEMQITNAPDAPPLKELKVRLVSA